ncbi:MAG: S9 family peptidase [Cyclonatronaceae bacterium]
MKSIYCQHVIQCALAALLLPLLILPVPVQAQLSPEDVVNIERVGQVVMHPQGTHVAYTLSVPRQPDEDIGENYSEVRVIDLETRDVSHIITRPQSASSLSWVPGTNRIAFRMVNQEYHNRPQVYSMDVVGGDLEQHTSAPEGVMDYAFSTDPSLLAYTMRSPYPEEVKERRDQGFDMEVSGENERHVRLWVQDSEGARPVTQADMTVWDFEWSPDNHRLALRMTFGTGLDDEMMFSEIKVLMVRDGSTDLLAESQGKVGMMAWSPDGNRFAFLGAKAINDPLPQRIYVTEVGNYISTDITPMGYEGTPEWLEWKDSNTLRFVAVEGTRTALREMSASGGETRLMAGGDLEIFRSVSFNYNQRHFAAAVHRRDHPPEVYLGNSEDTEWVRFTHHNRFLEERELGQQATIEWLGPDGLLIEGVLTYPIGYEEGRAYPLAILPHGGPEGVSIDGWNTRPLYPAQVLASRGYVVLEPNYRGSGGRGSWFTMANHRDLGGKEFEDVIRGIDHLAYQGVVDPKQVGISGTSYGGYFSAWAGTRYSDRFAAAVTFAGLSNWISFMGTTDIPHEMSITHWDLWWFENHGVNWDRSPVAHIQNARTPILVAHGLADDRVHPEQSIQLHQFLELNDIPTGLVMYPRQPHGLVERAHRLDFMERVIDWFDRYVKQD